MRNVLAAGFGLVVLIAAGCSAVPGGSATFLRLSVQDGPRGGSACSGSTTIEGMLSGNGDRVVPATSGANAVVIVWPNGYQARQTPSAVELLDQDGHVVAKVGERVRVAVTDSVEGHWFACANTPAVLSP
jgi:hypothetical protein